MQYIYRKDDDIMEENRTEAKKKIFSGVQPSGMLTIGNYLGSIKNWQKTKENFYALASLTLLSVKVFPRPWQAKRRMERNKAPYL